MGGAACRRGWPAPRPRRLNLVRRVRPYPDGDNAVTAPRPAGMKNQACLESRHPRPALPVWKIKRS